MRQNDPNSHDDELDRRIREALRVETSAEHLARLERFWQRQVAVREPLADRWRVVAWAAGLAVSAMVLVGVSVLFSRHDSGMNGATARQSEPDDHMTPEEVTPDATEEIAEASPAPRVRRQETATSDPRAPTVYEQFIFAARAPRVMGEAPSSAVAAVAATPAPSPRATIDEIVDRLAADADADPGELADSSGLEWRTLEPSLLQELRTAADERRRAVVRLLAVRGTNRSIPDLLEASRQKDNRDDCLAAIEQIVGVERMAGLLVHTRDRSVRAAIVGRLFTADTDTAMRVYLSLIHDEATRAEALAVAGTVSGPSLERLLKLLMDEDKSVRLSAALVLGRANGPEITRALIELVTREASSSTDARIAKERSAEAWIALLQCRGEQAEEFFAHVQYRPKLLGPFNRAFAQLAVMTQ